jgi:hypothetical protein
MSSKLAPDRPAPLPNRAPPAIEPTGTPPPMGDLWAAVRGWWPAAAGSQRLAYLAGAGLILVGVALGRTSSRLGPSALLDASTLLYLLAAGAVADRRRLRRRGRAAHGRGVVLVKEPSSLAYRGTDAVSMTAAATSSTSTRTDRGHTAMPQLAGGSRLELPHQGAGAPISLAWAIYAVRGRLPA